MPGENILSSFEKKLSLYTVYRHNQLIPEISNISKMPPKKSKKGPAKSSSKRDTEKKEEEEKARYLEADARGNEDLDRRVEEEYDSDISECSGTSETGKRKDQKSYNFGAADEHRLVDFFEANDCFYNKMSSKYCSSQYKNRILREMAAELSCEREYQVVAHRL